jgi:hypothetical protein
MTAGGAPEEERFKYDWSSYRFCCFHGRLCHYRRFCNSHDVSISRRHALEVSEANSFGPARPDLTQREARSKANDTCGCYRRDRCCGLAACSREEDVTKSTNACAAKMFSPFDPKNYDQCVKACIRCDNGVMTTCSTSCRLKGAR